MQILRRYTPDLSDYEEYYKDFHQNPDLSRQESRTAGIIADFLKSIGSYCVTAQIGGHGVVGVFENGPGPKVMLRADMDALPVPELTGLDYASKKKGVDPEGKQVPVMHACMLMFPLLAELIVHPCAFSLTTLNRLFRWA